MKITATRYHDFSTGHRVYGHESKCAHLHGHNYRIYFTLEGNQQRLTELGGIDYSQPILDHVGRVIDFSLIKDLLCEWLETNWDHKFLVWEDDPFAVSLLALDPQGVVITEFNPTAENMGQYLIDVVGPAQLAGTDVALTKVQIEETRKCSVDVIK